MGAINSSRAADSGSIPAGSKIYLVDESLNNFCWKVHIKQIISSRKLLNFFFIHAPVIIHVNWKTINVSTFLVVLKNWLKLTGYKRIKPEIKLTSISPALRGPGWRHSALSCRNVDIVPCYWGMGWLPCKILEAQ